MTFNIALLLGLVLLARSWGGLALIVLAAIPARVAAPWGTVTAFELTIVLALFIEVVHASRSGRPLFPPRLVTVPVALTIVWALASQFWAMDHSAWLERSAVFVQSGLAGWAVYLGTVRLGRDRAIDVIAWVGSLSAGWALIWFYLLDGAERFNLQPPATAADAVSQALRLGSPLVGPSNYFSSIILLSLPITLMAVRRRRAFALGALLQMSCLVATVSRGAILAATGLLIWAVLSYYIRRKRLPHLFWLPVFGIGLTLAWPRLTAFAGEIMDQRQLTSSNEGLSERTELWNAAVTLWSQHFWNGVGFGGWARQVGLAGGTGAHNFILQFGAELGAIGVFLMAWALLNHFRVFQSIDDPVIRSLAEALVVAGVVNGLVEASFEGVVYSWTLGLTLGVLLACASPTSSPPPPAEPPTTAARRRRPPKSDVTTRTKRPVQRRNIRSLP